MIIDSHCHIPLISDDKSDQARIVQNATNAGVSHMLCVSVDLQTFEDVLFCAKNYPQVSASVGVHPTYVAGNLASVDDIATLAEDPNVVAVGETGLDFYYNHSVKKDQISCFEEHIYAAQEKNLPLIVHTRLAENETFEILNKYRKYNLKILMHCFTGTKKFAEKLLDLDAYFSASGIITFKKTLELQETFKTIPINKLLIETDSPYLAPIPKRGKNNEPSFIKYTAAKLAELKNIDNNHLIDSTSQNFNNLFFK